MIEIHSNLAFVCWFKETNNVEGVTALVSEPGGFA